MNTEKPEKFYKYHSMTDSHSITNLNDKIIHFSYPKEFNDPYDCVGRLMVEYPGRFDISNEKYEELVKKVEKETDIKIETKISEFKETISAFIKRTPLYCLSQKNDNPLMWGHYADGLRGFCVEFEGNAEVLNKAMRVQYGSLPDASKTYEIMLHAMVLSHKYGANNEEYLKKTKDWMQKFFWVKLEDWHYEEEWRIGHPQEDQTKPLEQNRQYKENDVSSIIIGERMSDDNKKLIKDVVHRTYGNNVKLQLAKIEIKGIEIEPF